MSAARRDEERASPRKEDSGKAITVYGPGCMRCRKTEEIVRQVVEETGIEATVAHVTDMQAIVAAGVMTTPAVAVDGVVKLSGRIPKAEEVRQWITA
jgi:small redox-active disulfide protein 2